MPATQVDAKRRALAARLARLDPQRTLDYALLCHRTADGRRMRAAAHHREWVRLLEARERHPWLVIVAPPGYAKTSWVSHVYPAHRLGVTGGTARVGIISRTATQAYSNSKVVSDIVRSDAYRAAFPDVRPDMERGWRAGQRYFTNTPQGNTAGLTAAGIDGPIQGMRFDEIVLDDPTTFEDARSQTVMEAQRRFVTGTLIKRFPAGMGPPHGTGGRMVVVMTRWSQHDLLPTFIDLGFTVVRMPALGYWDRSARCPSCGEFRDVDLERLLGACEHCASTTPADVTYGEEPLWPEVESLAQLVDERENDEIIFQLVKQGDPSVLSGDMFDPQWFQRGEPPMDRDAFEVVLQGVDTSSGKSQAKGDYFALVTLGVTPAGDVWVLDVDRGRYPSPVQLDRVQAAFDRWQPELIVIEDANEGNALYQMLIAQPGCNLPLTTHSPVNDKAFRAIPLSNAYRAGKVWHPARARWRRSLEAELEAFPGGPHDDQTDAAALAWAKVAGGGTPGGGGPRFRTLSSRG